MDAWLEFVKLVLAGAVGGTIMPVLTHARERRAARAAVREHLVVVELSRGPSQGDWSQVRRALAAFEANALSAGLPRDIVTVYRRLVLVAWATADDDHEQHPDGASGVPIPLSDLVETAHGHVVDSMWRPWRSKIRRTKWVKELVRDVDELRARDDDSRIAWQAWRRSPNF